MSLTTARACTTAITRTSTGNVARSGFSEVNLEVSEDEQKKV
nr:MAG TPA: hypothetical protein [Caudoviricetes sp.]